jgi:NAD(P)-dependent dehydrogenase (short-subunit alcohol dehydrogenase family)
MKNKAVVITGAGKRLGREIAMATARLGYGVIGHYNRSKSDIQTLKRAVEAAGQPFFSIKKDFSRNAPGFIEKCAQFPVRLVGLVNSASVFYKGNLLDRDINAFQSTLNINTITPLVLSRDFAKKVSRGFIINIIDANIKPFNRKFQFYRISKRLLLDWTLECARLFAPKIRVNALSPGAILPSKYRGRAKALEKAGKAPLRTGGDVRGLVRAYEYLLASDSVTGQVLYVDGGMHLT